MSPAPHPARELRHRRSVDVQAFARPDGLWEVEAQVQDVKTRPMNLATGRLEAGQPLHEMGLWLLVDTQFNILDAQAQTRAAPIAPPRAALAELRTRSRRDRKSVV